MFEFLYFGVGITLAVIYFRGALNGTPFLIWLFLLSTIIFAWPFYLLIIIIKKIFER
jgi:hypothetical protein